MTLLPALKPIQVRSSAFRRLWRDWSLWPP